MGEIFLELKKLPEVPVEGGNLSPNAFAGRSIEEVKALPIREGNRVTPLSSFFNVEGESAGRESDVSIIVSGDLSKVRWLGHKMSAGRVLVKGSVGHYLGEEMTGGSIVVEGNADSFAGMMMKGGSIEIKGNARHFLGAGYRGSVEGMKGGSIVVHGDAGESVGYLMAGGAVRVKGRAGQFVGVHMKNGKILVEGDVGDRAGAGMIKGNIIVLGRIQSILPSFIVDRVRNRVKFEGGKIEGPFYVFKGDVTESWEGSLNVSVKSNPHLKAYESEIV
jgi:formylmethanofuran dehydrogenase subunit C